MDFTTDLESLADASILNADENNNGFSYNSIDRYAKHLLYAIQVKRLTFSYSESQRLVTILNRLNLNVPLGQIYGLLGPSGCGKTTLIRCVLSVAKPESGEIRLFHRKNISSNRKMLQIPGKDVGYMPQEYSLYQDLTVIEQLNYHKAIHNVDNEKFAAYKLLDLMELGDLTCQMVSKLSGGQARRLSFACALIHRPRLLILDEPTVGVDPILRKRIWQILEDYVTDCKASVLITTHYIEETRKAQTVGFMRRGHLLAEDHPEKLIRLFHVWKKFFLNYVLNRKKQSKLWKRTSLKRDAAFLRKRLDLQLRKLEASGANIIFEPDLSDTNDEPVRITPSQSKNIKKKYEKLKKKENDAKKKQMDSLLQLSRPNFLIRIYQWIYQLVVVTNKIFKQTVRQKAALFAQFILPLISIILFCLCVGGTPEEIPLAIVNHEQVPYLSLIYLKKLNPSIIKQVNYTNLAEALKSARSTKVWGVIEIPANFSSAFIERAQYHTENEGGDIKNDTLKQSTIKLYCDLSSKILSVTIQRSMDLSLREFLNETLAELGYKSNLLSLPIKLENAIFGSFYTKNNDNYYALRDYGVSGILIILTYSLSFGLTVMVLTEENKGKMFERNFVLGISSTVIILGHLIVRLVLCNLNVALLLSVAVSLFHAPITGPLYWAFSILWAQCLTGLTHGMMISALCTDFFMAAVLSNGILLMMFILSGVLWPVESLPDYLRYVSLIQPTTLPTQSLRWIMSKGSGIEEPHVYFGFIISGIYFIIFFIAAAIIFKYKR